MSSQFAEVQRQIAARQQQLKSDCAALFEDKPTITLEIGCGHGHYLTAYAEQHPEEFCVGIDLISKRIEKANAKGEKRELDNLIFIKAEVMEFLQALPSHLQLGRIFMLFPDPWPKKRHHKNRMIQPSFLDVLAELSTSEAAFHYRTDHRDYFDWTVEHIQANAHWQIDASAEWPFEEESFFQKMMAEWQSLIAIRRA